MQTEKYKVLDLFAGAGGFSLGFKKFKANGNCPYEIAGAVELDKQAVKTLVSAMVREGIQSQIAEDRVICGDITLNTTKEKLYNVCPRADIIIGGPPCQSFSTIGPRSGCKEKQARFANDERDSLFWHYIDIVKHYKPLFFVFENVTGITSKKNSQGAKYIDIITKTFESIGYNLESENESIDKKYSILNAADYGVPQIRKRVIIIGNRLNLVKNPFPERTHAAPEEADTLKLLPYVTLKDAIGDLPRVIPKITTTPTVIGGKLSDEQIKSIERKNKHRKNGNDPSSYHWESVNKFTQQGNEARKQFFEFIKPTSIDILLTGHIARGQQLSDIELFKGMRPGMSSKHIFRSQNPRYIRLRSLIKYKMESFEDKYKKLGWNEPCNTIFAHLQKDGNRFIHPERTQTRTLTVREAARIQSFPDDYVFEAVGNQRYKYIGNAVPPLMSYSIAKAVYYWLIKNNKD